MSTATGAVAGAMAQRSRVVRSFTTARAVSPESARTLDELGLSHGLAVRRMIQGGVLRESGAGRLWLDEKADAAFRRRARWAFAIAIGIGVVVIAIVLLR